jgi:hypothetical protein
MQRVDTATAIASPPTQDPVGTPGYFTKGNPTSGTPATVPGQDWFNAVQEEILAVIVAAGLTPSKSNMAQLLAAIKSDWERPARQCLLGLVDSTGTISKVSGSGAAIAWTVEDNDPYGLHATNSSQIICPTGYNRVRLFGDVHWGGSPGVGTRNIQVLRNGYANGSGGNRGLPGSVFSSPASVDVMQNFASSWIPCTAGDYFELYAQQSSGSTINILPDGTWFGTEFMKAV